MRKLFILIFLGLSLFSNSSFAMLSMELTRGVAGAVPIAIVPFSVKGNTPSQNVSDIVSNDLKYSGRFKVFGGNAVSPNMPLRYYKSIGAENVVIGSVEQVGNGRYQVNFKLLDTFHDNAPALLTKKTVVSEADLRRYAHHISDLVYQQITGVRGIFSTRLAYIVVQRNGNGTSQYTLEVSDADGYNPRPLLVSNSPIMSPAWSPNGKQIAYVSFEKKYAAIYIEDVATGSRRLVSDFHGINGAPAWSPDGSKLAMVLSKDGSPNIYVMDLASRRLTQITRDWSINTEPAWSPNGKSIIFTSNRGGGPQIYQKALEGNGGVTRITYDGNYNARPSFVPGAGGNRIVILNQESKLYNIGILDLNSGIFKVLTNSSGTDNESPSVAPNGSMILYGTIYGGRNMLAMVASDGSIEVRLPARNGDVQDPAWSPFLS